MITIIAGTNRPDSSTLKIAREVEDIYRKLEVKTQLLDLQELPQEPKVIMIPNIKPKDSLAVMKSVTEMRPESWSQWK